MHAELIVEEPEEVCVDEVKAAGSEVILPEVPDGKGSTGDGMATLEPPEVVPEQARGTAAIPRNSASEVVDPGTRADGVPSPSVDEPGIAKGSGAVKGAKEPAEGAGGSANCKDRDVSRKKPRPSSSAD